MTYVYSSTDGKIVCASNELTSIDGHGDLQITETSLALADVGKGAYVLSGAVVAMPPKPSEHHTFDYTTKQWIDPRTLADLQATRRAYVNTARLTANQAYFTHEGKQIAADPLSRSDIDAINGEVNNTGGFPAGWPGAWKCLDNTWLPVTTITQWKALYTSMVNQGTANFAHAQNLKAQIDAATTPEQVAAVIW